MNKQAIIERITEQRWPHLPKRGEPVPRILHQDACEHVETILNIANYFDLLEAARDVVMQNRYTSPTDNHEKVYCLECHREWKKHKSTCSTGALLEILKKAGVEVE